MRPPALFLALALVLAGCTSDKKAAPSPSPSPDRARERLTELARATAEADFDATYKFTARATAESGTIQWRQQPPQYRLDIKLGRTAAFFAIRIGYISCTQRTMRTDWSCFIVARPGEAIPDLFDPGVQRLFHNAVTEMSRHPEDYDVTALPAMTPTPAGPRDLPPSECFHVQRTSSPSPGPDRVPDGFETGDYCFAAQGLPTRYDVATGTLELVSIGPAVTAAAFRTPARPAYLPSLSPSPR